MSIGLIEIEIERIENLVRQWGWELVSKRTQETLIEAIWQKLLPRVEEETRDIFWMHVRNVLTTFGWRIMEETTEENLLSVRAEKAITA